MGRKPIEDKRVQLNRMVAGSTTPLLKNLALRLGASEGEVLDRAIQMLDVAESLPESLKPPKKSSMIMTVDEVADDVQSGDPIQVVSKTETVKPKFVPPTGKFFKRS